MWPQEPALLHFPPWLNAYFCDPPSLSHPCLLFEPRTLPLWAWGRWRRRAFLTWTGLIFWLKCSLERYKIKDWAQYIINDAQKKSLKIQRSILDNFLELQIQSIQQSQNMSNQLTGSISDSYYSRIWVPLAGSACKNGRGFEIGGTEKGSGGQNGAQSNEHIYESAPLYSPKDNCCGKLLGS